MKMKCDKNYFHVTPEHLTSDRTEDSDFVGLAAVPCRIAHHDRPQKKIVKIGSRNI